MEDRFAGIREFVLSVDGGSFTAAANALGVTGSAVGKSITKLEARVGAQLFHRTTRRLGLTTEGEAYLQSCRRVLEELEQAESFLASGHQEPIGRLRVDLPTTFGRRHIMPTLMELGLKHERLKLSVMLRDQPVDMVTNGIDLAVRIGELGDHPDLIAKRLGQQRLITCAAPSYIKRHDKPNGPHDLSKHDCLVGWYRGSRPRWSFKQATGEQELIEVSPRHELMDGDALLCVCEAGGGIAQLPNWLAEASLREGKLIPLLNEFEGPAMPIHVIWQKTWHFQPKVRVVVDEIVTASAKQPTVFAG